MHIAKACKTKNCQRTKPEQRARKTLYVRDSLKQTEHTHSLADSSYNLITLARND